MSECGRFEIVVGVNGSGSSLHAVKWAAAEAASRGGHLRLVHAWMWPLTHELRPAPSATLYAVDALRVLEVASLVAATVAPGLEVHTDLVTGTAELVLSDASYEADLLVLGDRGASGSTDQPVGLVAATMANLASCPVVIVRGRLARYGPVLVGVDGSDSDPSVLAAAFDRAERLATSVTAICASDARPHGSHPWSDGSPPADQVAASVLDEALSPFLLTYPSVQVEKHVVPERLTHALVLASDGAQIVVVGSHASQAVLRGLLAASTGNSEIHLARCPVEVVRDVASTRRNRSMLEAAAAS